MILVVTPPLPHTVHSVHHAGPRHRELRSAPDVQYVCVMCVLFQEEEGILFGAVEVKLTSVDTILSIMLEPHRV